MPAVFKNTLPLLLASASPRRRDLLRLIGLNFSLRAAKGESGPEAGESGPDYAARAAREKALSVLDELAAEWAAERAAEKAAENTGPAAENPAALPVILAADTIVLFAGEIFGKPATPEHSLAMLQRLAGQTHQVITACHLLLPPALSGNAAGPGLPCGYGEARLSQTSRVTFWNAPAAALRAYAQSGATLDKAGSYAMQGEGGWLVRQIEGSWSNVVGLPLSELTEFLLERNIITACSD